MVSLASQLALHPEILASISDEDLAELEYDWLFWARPNQIEPEEFKSGLAQAWLLLSGRGWGKTRTGSETTNDRVRRGDARNIALVGQSVADVRDVMVEGPSGLVQTSHPRCRAVYQSSRRRVIWPNGAVAHLYTAEDPDQLRGPQHDFAWCDEIAAWPHLSLDATWSNLMFGLRIGRAQVMITTTPRPIKIIKDLIKRTTTYLTRGTTYENLENLSESYRDNVIAPYEGTRLGRQELLAEVLEDTPGAMWTYEIIERNRVAEAPSLKSIAVAVDPTGSSEGHEVGITVGGLGYDDLGYLLADLSMQGRPDDWANRALAAYDFYEADCIVVETNYGGEMVANTIHSLRPSAPVREVRAARGKSIRAEPISLLNEQNRIKFVGTFPLLEDQLTSWVPEDGPNDRLDSYVWLFTHLAPPRKHSGRLWIAGEEDVA